LNKIDELRLYRGNGHSITDKIIVRHPTVGDICDHGEQRYYSMVHQLCYVGADLKWQLDENGIDYTKISDYDLFCQYISRLYKKEDTEILLGELDLSKFELMINLNIDEVVLHDSENDITINRYIYNELIGCIRKMHGIERNNEMPGNESTREILIIDAKEEYEMNKNKPYKSSLLHYVSALVNSDGFKKDNETVFLMPIYTFMDSVKRIAKISSSKFLIQSGYSGFGINLKDIDKKEIDWMGEL